MRFERTAASAARRVHQRRWPWQLRRQTCCLTPSVIFSAQWRLAGPRHEWRLRRQFGGITARIGLRKQRAPLMAERDSLQCNRARRRTYVGELPDFSPRIVGPFDRNMRQFDIRERASSRLAQISPWTRCLPTCRTSKVSRHSSLTGRRMVYSLD